MKPITLVSTVFIGLSLASAGITARAADVGAKAIEISVATQSALAGYLKVVKTTRPGAFAVSEDGVDSFYFYCDDIACVDSTYGVPAVRGCESLSGKFCVLLYVRDRSRIEYSLAAPGGPSGRHGSKAARAFSY